MNTITPTPETLAVSDIPELSGASASAFRETLKSALTSAHRALEVDLSATRFLDSNGLGALITLHKAMCARGGHLVLVNPSPTCRQLLELTRMHRILEIVSR